MARPALNVLLVEDNPDDARLLLFELENGGHAANVDRVWTEDAYREKLATRPDIILADYTLPRFGALPALRILRELDVDIPLIVVTGTIGEDKAVECMHLGAADYLLKDRLARLSPAVGRALAEKQARDAKRGAEEALLERLRFEELLATLSAGLINTSGGNLDAALSQLLGAVATFHHCDQIVVRAFDPVRKELTAVQAWRSPNATVGQYALRIEAAGFGWPEKPLLEGQSILAWREDLPAGAENLRMLMKRDDIEYAAFLPLRVENETIGLLGLNWQRKPANLPSDLLSRLNLLAEVVANTFGRQRAEQALSERLRFEELIVALSTRLINTPPSELDNTIVQVVGAVAEFHGSDQAIVRRLDPATGQFSMSHCWRSPHARVAPAIEVVQSTDYGWSIDELRQHASFVLHRNQLPDRARHLQPALEESGIAAQVALPLRIEKEVVGTIGLQWHDEQELGGGVLNRLSLLAEILANTLGRQRAEEQREQAFAELERLKRAAELERDYLREELREPGSVIIGASGALRSVLDMVEAVSSTKATVLIRGESGVGKEVIARAIHERSPRGSGPLVKVNCASIPKELFESEFFGHVKGSFTGALRNRAGRFELADGGTIFLDEVGEIPMDMQSKLLRVLQESEFERVGDDRTRRVDVRVVAATNRDLEADVQSGTFRRDLYYRLNVFPIEVPPLRKRRGDILALAEFFLNKCCQDMRRSELTITAEQRRLLEAYDWPGNVRELEHVIERAVILSPVPPLRLDLALAVGSLAAAPARPSGAIMTDSDLRTLERDNIVAALERAQFRISGSGGAAELLGLSPSTLRDRMKALNIQRPEG